MPLYLRSTMDRNQVYQHRVKAAQETIFLDAHLCDKTPFYQVLQGSNNNTVQNLPVYMLPNCFQQPKYVHPTFPSN